VDRYPFDAEYLRRLRDADPMTVDHFVTYFTAKLSIKLFKSGFSQSDRDDIVQETFARFFAKLRMPDGIQSPESLGAFVFRTCDHVVFERYRINAKQDQLDDDCVNIPALDLNIEQLIMRGEEAEVVRRTLQLMTAKERQLLIDVFVTKRPKDEICREHGYTRDYLRVVVHRAIARFRFLYPNGKGKPPRRGQ